MTDIVLTAQEAVAEKEAQPGSARQPEGEQPSSPRRICFVCTGNTCRSPMASAVFNDLAAREAGASAAWLGTDPTARPVALSAGLEAEKGAPITDLAVVALGEAGIPSVPGNAYADHTARQADRALLASCDLIVGISRRHAMALIFRYPELADRITAMPRDIPDPFGGDLSVYRACLAALTQGIQDMFFPQSEG